jgi:hypothetical protein
VTDHYRRGAGPFVHAAVPVELKQVGFGEDDRDGSGRETAQRCCDRPGVAVVGDVADADVGQPVRHVGRGLGEPLRAEDGQHGVMRRPAQGGERGGGVGLEVDRFPLNREVPELDGGRVDCG